MVRPISIWVVGRRFMASSCNQIHAVLLTCVSPTNASLHVAFSPVPLENAQSQRSSSGWHHQSHNQWPVHQYPLSWTRWPWEEITEEDWFAYVHITDFTYPEPGGSEVFVNSFVILTVHPRLTEPISGVSHTVALSLILWHLQQRSVTRFWARSALAWATIRHGFVRPICWIHCYASARVSFVLHRMIAERNLSSGTCSCTGWRDPLSSFRLVW
jgi:hypothetical protein